MFGEENCFHSRSFQVFNSTSGKPSRATTGVYYPQLPTLPNHGTRLETSTRKSGSPSAIAPLAELLLVSVFLLSLFLAGCSPGSYQTSLVPPESSPVVVISGSSAVSGDLVVDRLISVQNRGQGAIKNASDGFEDLSIQGVPESLSYQEQLSDFSQQPAVQDRVRRVMGWLEFGRSKVVLPRLQQGAIRVSSTRNPSAKVSQSDSELRDRFLQSREFALWRELLADPEVEFKFSAEELSAVQLRLNKTALVLATAKQPEDVQELDQLLLKD